MSGWVIFFSSEIHNDFLVCGNLHIVPCKGVFFVKVSSYFFSLSFLCVSLHCLCFDCGLLSHYLPVRGSLSLLSYFLAPRFEIQELFPAVFAHLLWRTEKFCCLGSSSQGKSSSPVISQIFIACNIHFSENCRQMNHLLFNAHAISWVQTHLIC